MTVSISSTLKTTAPLSIRKEGAVFNRITRDILGDSYELSLVFIGNTRSRNLNKTWRAKDKPTNVLSFPLSSTIGELYINIPLAVREARVFETTPRKHIFFLFIHGILHLKGYDHGKRMEQAERSLMKKYFKT